MTAILETLVRASVGNLFIADRDYVEAPNLQQLFTEQDAINGMSKVVVAERRLKGIRSDLRIRAVFHLIKGPLVEELADSIDIIVD